MNASELALLQSSLALVKQRFQAIVGGSPSKAWLLHVHDNKSGGTPTIYALADGYDSPAVESKPSTWNRVGCPAIGYGVPRFRRGVRLNGSESLTPICDEAARLLMSLPAAVQSRLWRGLPAGTELRPGEGNLLWALAVFELANANVAYSSLRAVRQTPLTEETAKAFFSGSKMPADADWYATLPDFAAASVQAIDILQSWLADELNREDEAKREQRKRTEQPGTKRTYYATDVEHLPERLVCDLFPCAKDAFDGVMTKEAMPGEIMERQIVGPGVNVTRRMYCPTDDEMATLQRAGGWHGAMARLVATGQTVLAIEQMDAPEILRRLSANTSDREGQDEAARLEEFRRFSKRQKAIYERLAEVIAAIRNEAATSKEWLENLEMPGLSLRDEFKRYPPPTGVLLRDLSRANKSNLLQVRSIDLNDITAHHAVRVVTEFFMERFTEFRKWDGYFTPEESRRAQIVDLRQKLADINVEDLAARLDTEFSVLEQLFVKPVGQSVETKTGGSDKGSERGEAEGKPAKGKRGRRKGVPASDVKQDQRIADAWAKGYGQYKTQEELATAFGIDKSDVVAALDRHRKRLAKPE